MPDICPLQLLLATFAGWVNRQQTQMIGRARYQKHKAQGLRPCAFALVEQAERWS